MAICLVIFFLFTSHPFPFLPLSPRSCGPTCRHRYSARPSRSSKKLFGACRRAPPSPRWLAQMLRRQWWPTEEAQHTRLPVLARGGAKNRELDIYVKAACGGGCAPFSSFVVARRLGPAVPGFVATIPVALSSLAPNTHHHCLPLPVVGGS